jgi:hypothetical protein
MASHLRRRELPTEQSANSSALVGFAKIESTASIKKTNLLPHLGLPQNTPVKGK